MKQEDQELLARLGLKRGDLATLGELALARRLADLERRIAALESNERASLGSIMRRFTRVGRSV
jgi:hypothetical protein